jgi:hypothetical protein
VDKARGYWLASLVGNWTGLPYEGRFLEEPAEAQGIQWALLEEYTTDDDTLVEWVSLHILETHGLWPSYEEIRDEWVAHLNNDIWWANRRARDLMDQGVVPPATGSARLNPHSGWNIDAQIQSEIFGVIAPGMPLQAQERAVYFSRISNHGVPVETASFYAVMYALAFFDTDPREIIREARRYFPPDSPASAIAAEVIAWHRANPGDWRPVRELIGAHYADDPGWNAARVNFASTLMALLYGQGDFERTLTIAALAGWDADNNTTTSAGLLGITLGHSGLPAFVREGAGDVYRNIDVTGALPETERLGETASRLQQLAEAVITTAGGTIEVQGDERIYLIPEQH